MEQNNPVMPLVENTVVGGKGANRSKRVGFMFGSVKQRRADALEVLIALRDILNAPAYRFAENMDFYLGKLDVIALGTEGQLVEQAAPEEVKP